MKQPLIFFIFSNVTTVSGNITSPSVLPTRSPFSTEIPSYPKSLLTRSPFLPEVLSYPESFLTPKTLLSETPPFSTLLFFCSFVLFSFRSFLLPSFSPFLLFSFSPSVLLFFCLYLRSKYTIGTQQSPPSSASHTRTYSIYTENLSKQPPTNLSHPIRERFPVRPLSVHALYHPMLHQAFEPCGCRSGFNARCFGL